MFKDINNLLRLAYQGTEDGDRVFALQCIYQALDIARQTNNRVLRAHIVQCSERVKGTL